MTPDHRPPPKESNMATAYAYLDRTPHGPISRSLKASTLEEAHAECHRLAGQWSDDCATDLEDELDAAVSMDEAGGDALLETAEREGYRVVARGDAHERWVILALVSA